MNTPEYPYSVDRNYNYTTTDINTEHTTHNTALTAELLQVLVDRKPITAFQWFGIIAFGSFAGQVLYLLATVALLVYTK
jgi:hypothetical protein